MNKQVNNKSIPPFPPFKIQNTNNNDSNADSLTNAPKRPRIKKVTSNRIKQRKKSIQQIDAPKAKKRKVGHPFKWKTPEELHEQIDNYFQWAEENNKPLTVERLACFLDVSFGTIRNYTKKDEFKQLINKAYKKIISWKVETLYAPKANIAGIIFDLANNAKYYRSDAGQAGVAGLDGKAQNISLSADTLVKLVNTAVDRIEKTKAEEKKITFKIAKPA